MSAIAIAFNVWLPEVNPKKKHSKDVVARRMQIVHMTNLDENRVHDQKYPCQPGVFVPAEEITGFRVPIEMVDVEVIITFIDDAGNESLSSYGNFEVGDPIPPDTPDAPIIVITEEIHDDETDTTEEPSVEDASSTQE